ncbi:MAG: hypothetical protein QOJ00_240 [Actinomycetota bacterium]|jgi:AcrR family transcriptional regulator
MTSDVAARVAQQTLAGRGAAYTDEVRRLLDAALEVMRQRGTGSRPRVADIVAAAGLSNDAFYRHFPSKDALVAALLEDGTERLRSYLAHQMDKQRTPESKIRRWVRGVFDQAQADVGEATRAALFNAAGAPDGRASGRHPASGVLADLLHEPFAALGSAHPELDASLCAHAVLGRLADHLWERTQPSVAEISHIGDVWVGVAKAARSAR